MCRKETESEAITRHIILANKKEEGPLQKQHPGGELRSTIKQKYLLSVSDVRT